MLVRPGKRQVEFGAVSRAGDAVRPGIVEQIAGSLEKMPPKSTYFYPKLLSGLVFHSLKAN